MHQQHSRSLSPSDDRFSNASAISNNEEPFINNVFSDLDPQLDIDFQRVYSSDETYVSIYKTNYLDNDLLGYTSTYT